MVRNALLRRTPTWAIAAIMACFGFTGLASAQTITNTGPDSTNTISSSRMDNCAVINSNRVSATSFNSQWAQSGDATVAGNTTAGLPWTGWSTLDPAVWQQNGQSYSAWQTGLTQWLSQRAGGAGWNTATINLTWVPSNTTAWSSWNPLLWQQNGQSFQNWYAQLNAHLASTATNLLSNWPAGATGNGLNLGGATSGDATNHNSTSFMMTITNGAAASTPSSGSAGCSSHSLPGTPGTPGTPATPGTPGSNGGLGGHIMGASIGGGGSGNYYPAGGGFGGYNAPAVHTASTTGVPSTPGTPPTPGSGGSGSGGHTPGTPSSSTISNTGPGSTNTISSNYTGNATVTNNNTVSVVTSNCQSAESGDATVADNTTTGSSGSGTAANNNGTGTDVDFGN